MVQGDVSCGGDGSMRRWSSDLEAMDRRIEAAFRVSGLGEPLGVTVIGYSQGAERVERLVARWPKRYSSAILVSSHVVPSPHTLSRAKAIVLIVGSLESQDKMRDAVQPLIRAAVPTGFLVLPHARHGQLGPEPSLTMGQALDFIDKNESGRREDEPKRAGAGRGEPGPSGEIVKRQAANSVTSEGAIR
jgi:pimeloyl-ACP methyl ester carboxylesterase